MDPAHPNSDPQGDVSGNPPTKAGELEEARKDNAALEKYLRDSQAKYKALVQTMSDIVYILNEEGHFTFLNRAVSQIGYQPEDLIGRHFSCIVHPDDIGGVSRSAVLPRYAGRITGDGDAPKLFDERRSGARGTIDLEVRILPRRAGEEKDTITYSLVCSSGYYTGGENGTTLEFIGTIGVMRDITHRKKTEASLREREAFNFALFEYNPISTVVVDLEGRVTKSNLARRRSTERLPDLGEPMFRDSESGFGIDMYGELMKCIRSKTIRHYDELRCGERVLSITISPFAFGAIICSRDITQRVRAEEALRESEKRFRETADLLPSVICEFDLSEKITYANRMGCTLLGYSRDDIARGVTLMEILHPEEHARARERVPRIQRGEDVGAAEYRMLARDGTELQMIVTSAPIYRKGVVCGVRSNAVDITYRKRMEEEVRKSRILESIGVLAGGIGHDFNNILAGISGNVQLARKKLLRGEPVGNHLDGVDRATERAAGLARQLLTFSKGGLPVRKLASVSELLRERVDFCARSLEADCRLVPEHLDQLWSCEIDAAQIAQVLDNLVANAVQAIPRGESVAVEAKNVWIGPDEDLPLNEGPFVKVVVEDRGVGIPREYLGKVFEPYFSTKQKASGLGLAAAYSIVTRHDGHIEVKSEPGKGTRVEVYLPALPAESPGPGAAPAPVPESRPGRILLMDDDEILRNIGKEVLEDAGMEVELADDGTAALKAYTEARERGDPFDVVILDLTIPGGMGGKEACERLRQFDPDVKTVVSSGYSDDAVMAHPEQHGFNGVVSKPYDVDEMIAIMQNLIDRD